MTLRRALTGAALLLGGLAAIAGEPRPGGQRDHARAVAAGEGRAGVVTVAGWIRSRLPGLRIIDLRSAEAFSEGPALPGAVNLTVESLADLAPDPGATTVLYADRPALAAQAWLLLRLRGDESVWYLEYGLEDWVAGIEAPVLPDSATADELAAWPAVAELSRYFGGLPRRGGARPAGGRIPWLTPDGAAPSGAPTPVRRVGCGF